MSCRVHDRCLVCRVECLHLLLARHCGRDAVHQLVDEVDDPVGCWDVGLDHVRLLPAAIETDLELLILSCTPTNTRCDPGSKACMENHRNKYSSSAHSVTATVRRMQVLCLISSGLHFTKKALVLFRVSKKEKTKKEFTVQRDLRFHFLRGSILMTHNQPDRKWRGSGGGVERKRKAGRTHSLMFPLFLHIL